MLGLLFVLNQKVEIIFGLIFLIIITFITFYSTNKKLKFLGNQRSFLAKQVTQKLIEILNLHKENFLYQTKNQRNLDYMSIVDYFKVNSNKRFFINVLPKVIFESVFIIFFICYLIFSLNTNTNNNFLVEQIIFIVLVVSRLLPSYLRLQQKINNIVYLKKGLDNCYRPLIISKKMSLEKSKTRGSLSNINSVKFKM